MIDAPTSSAAAAQVYGLASTGNFSSAISKMSSTQIDRTSQDFESMFLSQMLEQTFGDSIGSSAFGDDETGEVYKGLMMDAYGKEIARAGGIGIASYVKKELLKLQEKQP